MEEDIVMKAEDYNISYNQVESKTLDNRTLEWWKLSQI